MCLCVCARVCIILCVWCVYVWLCECNCDCECDCDCVFVCLIGFLAVQHSRFCYRFLQCSTPDWTRTGLARKVLPCRHRQDFEGPAHCRPIPIGNAAARPDTFTRLCDCVTIAGWWFPSQRKRVQPVSHVPFVLLTFCTGTDEARKCARDTCSRRGHTNNWSSCK